MEESSGQSVQELTLAERLRLRPGSMPALPCSLARSSCASGEEFDPVPIPLLRKYVAYARKYVMPKLSPEAASLLQQV
jgi:DNA replicative helicase MCM subunit Mcm2 (Cdc46/Mcm family)